MSTDAEQDERLHERTGLPGPADVEVALERMAEHFDDLREQLGYPSLQQVETKACNVDRWWEQFGDNTGLPTYHDLFDTVAELREELRERVQQHEDPPPTESDKSDDANDEWNPWPWLALGGYLIYRALNRDITLATDYEFEIDGFELEGIPITQQRTRAGGPPFAARLGDPMFHGGMARPGQPRRSVKIGGRPALVLGDPVKCPIPSPILGTPHEALEFETINRTVFVENKPLLRSGDWLNELVGGPNPIIAGMPTVFADKPAPSAQVYEFRYVPLDEFVPGLERVGWSGATIKLTGSVSQNLLHGLGFAAAGLASGWLTGSPLPGLRVAAFLFDGPTVTSGIELDFGDVFGEFRYDFELPVDLDGDGQRDRPSVRVRPELDLGDVKESASVRRIRARRSRSIR